MTDYSEEKPKWEEEVFLFKYFGISSTIKLFIFLPKAGILYIEFEGRSDGESIENLIESIKPKRTILVRGSLESCQKLQSFCLAGNYL